MDRPDSPSLIDLEKRQARGPWRLVFGMVAAFVLLSGLGTVGWMLLRPGPCRQAAQAICDAAGMPECPLAGAVADANLPRARCEEVLAGTRALESMPPHVRAAASASLMEDLMVGRELADRARAAIDAVQSQRAPDGSVRPEAREALVALGPTACLTILGRLSFPDPVSQSALRAVLVRHAGRDYGATPTAWMPWCASVIKSAPRTP